MSSFVLRLLALLAAILPAGRAIAVFTPGVNARTLLFDAQTRDYDVYVPASYDGSQPVPLVVDMHGYTSNRPNNG